MGQLSEFLKKFKTKIAKQGSKKLIEKMAIIAIVGVIIIIAGSVLFEDNLKALKGPSIQEQQTLDTIETSKQTSTGSQNEMEKNLQSILSKIKGVGEVDVMITFYSGSESIPAVDETTSVSDTQEKDKEGGTRSIKQTDTDNQIVFEENQGVKKPFIKKEILPEVKGVVIVAEGVDDVQVKSNLAKAAQALLEIDSHKIQVFARNSN